MSEVLAPKRQAVERLKKRVEGYRKHGKSRLHKYGSTLHGLYEREMQETLLLKQRFLDSKAKKSTKKNSEKKNTEGQSTSNGMPTPPRYGKRPAESAADGDPQSSSAESSTTITTSSSVSGSGSGKFSVEIVQQLEFSSENGGHNQQISTNISVKTSVKNENKDSSEDFSRFNVPEDFQKFLSEDSNEDLINADTFKDLISEITELPPDFMGDIDFEVKDGGASGGLKQDDMESADRAIRAAIEDMESRDKMQPPSAGRPSYDQAALTLRHLAEQHQQKNQGQYNNRTVPPNFRTSDPAFVKSEPKFYSANPSPLDEGGSPYVKKELSSPLPSAPSPSEKRTLTLSPVSKASPGGQFKGYRTDSPSVPGPSPQGYSQHQDNQNQFNKGFNSNFNPGSAQFSQSQSSHYSQKMSPFNGDVTVQQNQQMSMSQNGQFMQVSSNQHMQMSISKPNQQENNGPASNSGQGTPGHNGSNMSHMNGSMHSPMNVQSPMGQMMSPMMVGPGPSPQMPQHHIHHMQNQGNHSSGQAVQMPRPSPNAGQNVQGQQMVMHGQKMAQTPGVSPNMNQVQSQMMATGSPMPSVNQSQGQTMAGQSQMCQNSQNNQPGLNQSIVPNQMGQHMGHGPNGQQGNMHLNMMQCQSMQGQFASGQMPNGQFVPNSMQRLPTNGQTVMPMTQSSVGMGAQGQNFQPRMTSQNFRPGISNQFDMQQQMMAQRAAQQQQMRMQMMQQSQMQVQHGSMAGQTGQSSNMATPHGPGHMNSQMPTQNMPNQSQMQTNMMNNQMTSSQVSQMAANQSGHMAMNQSQQMSASSQMVQGNQMGTSPNALSQMGNQGSMSQMSQSQVAQMANQGNMGQTGSQGMPSGPMNGPSAVNQMGGTMSAMGQMSRPPPPEYRARMLASQQQSMMANMRPSGMRPGMAIPSQVPAQRMMQPMAAQQNFMVARPARPPNVTIVPEQWRPGIRNPQMMNYQQNMSAGSSQIRMNMPNQQGIFMQNMESVQAQQQRYMIQNPQGQMSVQQMQASQSMMMSQGGGAGYQQPMGNGHAMGYQRMQSSGGEFEFENAQFGASDAQDLLNSFDSSGGFNMM